MTVFQLKIKSSNKDLLAIYSLFLKNILKKGNIKFSLFNNPILKKKITLLKSPHVHKKAREQFELRVHRKTFFIKNVISLSNFNKLLINKPKLININIKYLGK